MRAKRRLRKKLMKVRWWS